MLLYNTHMKSLKNVEDDKIYIVGVSGGPDSMALLDLCDQAGIKVVVAHVNYQKRDSAWRDETIVKDYCNKRKIPCVVLHQEKACVGNFQAFAREERYRFYKQLMDDYQGEAVLLAHHLDDHLETYLMQEQRHSKGCYHGIKEEVILYGCKIIRPLMDYTKQDLLAYCIEKQVPYGFDESNFSDDYTRNKIRHQMIDNMSRKEKEELALKIAKLNAIDEKKAANHRLFLTTWQQDVESLLHLSKDDQKACLRMWIKDETKQHISDKFLTDILSCLPSKKNICMDVHPSHRLEKEYGFLHLSSVKDASYAYCIDCIKEMQTPHFSICKEGPSTCALTLTASDFPLVIRNAKQGDEIKLRFGTKKINRWFIDRKIPQWQRRVWPVVENSSHQVILVPQIGCDIEHFSNTPDIFVVK